MEGEGWRSDKPEAMHAGNGDIEHLKATQTIQQYWGGGVKNWSVKRRE